jgi:hypothetical protein
LRVVRPDLPPDLLRERGEREDVDAGGLEVVGDVREFLADGVDEPVVLAVDGVGVGLVVDRAGS